MQGLGASSLLSRHFACFQADLGDHSACVLSKSVQKQAPSPPFPLQVSSIFGEYGGLVSIYPLIWFQCDSVSW